MFAAICAVLIAYVGSVNARPADLPGLLVRFWLNALVVLAVFVIRQSIQV